MGYMERPTESRNRSPLLYFNCSEWVSWSEVSWNTVVVKMAFWKFFSSDCGRSMVDKKDKTLCIGRGYSCENKMLPIPWLEMSHLNNHLIYRVVGPETQAVVPLGTGAIIVISALGTWVKICKQLCWSKQSLLTSCMVITLAMSMSPMSKGRYSEGHVPPWVLWFSLYFDEFLYGAQLSSRPVLIEKCLPMYHSSSKSCNYLLLLFFANL